MVKPIYFTNKIKDFNKKISVDGDKCLSIRWTLLASMANGKSKAYNLLKSNDVLSSITVLKKLGVKIKHKKKYCEINGNGLKSFNYKKNLTINAGNSGTLGRLILALLINSPEKITLIGDRAYQKEIFQEL